MSSSQRREAKLEARKANRKDKTPRSRNPSYSDFMRSRPASPEPRSSSPEPDLEPEASRSSSPEPDPVPEAAGRQSGKQPETNPASSNPPFNVPGTQECSKQEKEKEVYPESEFSRKEQVHVVENQDVDGESTAGKTYWICCKKEHKVLISSSKGTNKYHYTWKYRLKKSWPNKARGETEDWLGGEDRWWSEQKLEKKTEFAAGEERPDGIFEPEENCCDKG